MLEVGEVHFIMVAWCRYDAASKPEYGRWFMPVLTVSEGRFGQSDITHFFL
jgi:hypothetical protein